MRFNKIMFLGLLLMAVLTVGAVSASQDLNSSDIPLAEIGEDADIVHSSDVESVAADADGVSDESSDRLASDEVEVLSNGTSEMGKISISNSSFTYGDNETISLKLPVNATGNLILENFGNKTSVPLVNGSASILLNFLGVGTYEIHASYDGADYQVNKTSFDIKIYPKATYPKSMKVCEDKYIILELNKDAIGSFEVYADWEFYYGADVVDGIARIPLSKLQDGEWDLNIKYTGSTEELVLVLSIEVKPVPAKIIANNFKMNYLDGKKFTVKVYGTNGRAAVDEYVEIKIGKNYYDAWTDKNGIAKFKITSPPGKYKVKVIYEDASVTKTLEVKNTLKLATVKVKKSAKKLVLTATLKQGKKPVKDQKITFKFNGKKITAKTNKNGVAKVTVKKSVLKKLKVGKKVNYQATYKKETVKKSVKVKR